MAKKKAKSSKTRSKARKKTAQRKTPNKKAKQKSSSAKKVSKRTSKVKSGKVTINTGRISKEHKIWAIVAVMTSYLCGGLGAAIIFFMKRDESKFVAYYAALGMIASAIAWVVFPVALIFWFGSFLASMGTEGPLAFVVLAVSGLSYILAAITIPGLFFFMVVCAVTAYNGKIVQVPVLSRLGKRLAGA